MYGSCCNLFAIQVLEDFCTAWGQEYGGERCRAEDKLCQDDRWVFVSCWCNWNWLWLPLTQAWTSRLSTSRTLPRSATCSTRTSCWILMARYWDPPTVQLFHKKINDKTAVLLFEATQDKSCFVAQKIVIFKSQLFWYDKIFDKQKDGIKPREVM